MALLTGEKSKLDQEAIAQFDKRKATEAKIDGYSYKKIQGERVTWNELQLREFLLKKFGPKIAMKIVKTRTVVELDVDEEELAKLSKKKKISNKKLSKYVNIQQLKPYIRRFDAKDDE